MPSRPRSALQRRAFWPRRCRGPCNVARAFRVRETCIHAAGTCSTGKVIAFSTFQVSEIPRHKKKERRYRFKNTGGAGHTILGYFPRTSAGQFQIPDSTPRPGFWRTGQFPKTGSGHPESRFRASPRILELGQISRSRYRHAESRLRASPCDLEIERQNTDSKFRDSSFCLRSCTHASSQISDRSVRCERCSPRRVLHTPVTSQSQYLQVICKIRFTRCEDRSRESHTSHDSIPRARRTERDAGGTSIQRCEFKIKFKLLQL